MRISVRNSLASGAALAYALVGAPAVYAQASYSFDLPAQELGKSLREIARRTGSSIVFEPNVARGKKAPALKGSYSAAEAVRLVLEGSGLQARQTSGGSWVVTAPPVAQQPGVGGSGAQSVAFEASGAAEPVDQQEIVVTGSIIRGAVPSGANLIVLDRQDLDNTGRGTLAEAIQTVPQVHGGGANAATTRSGIGAAPNFYGSTGNNFGASSLNLRGLGVEETLTLVNGRRLAPAGTYGAFADISALPMGAVDRVEILADGASATYGADAMAGVVNIIMNRSFEGAETRLRAGIETRSGEPRLQASQTFGWTFDGGNLLLSADYSRQDAVTSEGRPFAASADLRRLGGRDWRQSYCSPGNIIFPGELAGAIPPGQDGRALTPDQIRRGEINKCERFAESSHLIPGSEKGSVYAAGSYDVTDRLRVTADAIAALRSTDNVTVQQYFPLAVPTSNAFRQLNGFHGDPPLDQDIYVTYQFSEVEPLNYDVEAWSLLTSLGADYKLQGDWQLSVTGAYGRYDSTSKVFILDTRLASEGGALERALASSDLATAFNPFGDSDANSRALVESFFYPFHDLQVSDYRSASLKLGGSLAELPGGAIKLAVGGDYRGEAFTTRSRDYYHNLAGGFQENKFRADRDVAAAYAELFVPVFSERNAVDGARRLSVSISGRYDHYSDFGSTFNPKVGVTWVPANGLTFRGTYGTSFKAPLLTSLYEPSSVFLSSAVAIPGAPDTNGDGYVSLLYVLGGNPGLSPEKGKSWTIGAEFKPVMHPGLRVYANYFNLRFTDRFSLVSNPLLVFADPAAYQGIAYVPLPSQSEVDNLISSVDQVLGGLPPAGSVEAIIDSRTLNFASQVIDGFDTGAAYRWNALGGAFHVRGDVSYLSRYKSRLGQSANVTSNLGNVGMPARWKARGGLGWESDGVSFDGWVNHTAKYMNRMVQPAEPVSSYTTIDLSTHVELGKLLGRGGDGASLALYVTNVFDRAPPFVNSAFGYDGANADAVGRQFAIQITSRW